RHLSRRLQGLLPGLTPLRWVLRCRRRPPRRIQKPVLPLLSILSSFQALARLATPWALIFNFDFGFGVLNVASATTAFVVAISARRSFGGEHRFGSWRRRER